MRVNGGFFSFFFKVQRKSSSATTRGESKDGFTESGASRKGDIRLLSQSVMALVLRRFGLFRKVGD